MNCLPKPLCHGATSMQPLTVIDGRDPMPTPYLDNLENFAQEYTKLTAVDTACDAIRALNSGSMKLADVIEVIKALEHACDGDSSINLQICREALEADLPAVEKFK